MRGTGGLRGGSIDARGDHRMAMMGAVAGLASREGVEVVGIEAAAVSYPGFVEDLGRIVVIDIPTDGARPAVPLPRMSASAPFIVVTGNIAAGKSTLIEHLAAELRLPAYPERVGDNPFFGTPVSALVGV